MNTKLINTTVLAREIEHKILDRFEADWERACRDGDAAQGLKALYISDAGDMLEVCRLISLGDTTRARAALNSMDTAPREELYSIIESTALSEFVDSW